MKGFLILGMALALLAAFVLPNAHASQCEFNTNSELNLTATVEADSGGSLLLVSDLHRTIDLRTHEADLSHASLVYEQHSAAIGGGLLFDVNEAAKFDPGPIINDVACRPFRAIGRGLRGLGRGIGRAFGSGRSC